jgi:hypothetical protein
MIHGFISKEWPNVGPGWWPLLDELSDKLDNLNIQIDDYKEKFGILRVYLEMSFDEDEALIKQAYEIVHEYENKSASICEWTGSPGKLYKVFHWLKTASEEVYLKSLKNNRWIPFDKERYV